jgi:hypothetical protein
MNTKGMRRTEIKIDMGCSANDQFEWIWKDVFVALLKYCAGICLQWRELDNREQWGRSFQRMSALQAAN